MAWAVSSAAQIDRDHILGPGCQRVHAVEHSWIRGKWWRGLTLDLCGKHAHTGFTGDLLEAVRGVERTVEDLRKGGA